MQKFFFQWWRYWDDLTAIIISHFGESKLFETFKTLYTDGLVAVNEVLVENCFKTLGAIIKVNQDKTIDIQPWNKNWESLTQSNKQKSYVFNIFTHIVHIIQNEES